MRARRPRRPRSARSDGGRAPPARPEARARPGARARTSEQHFVALGGADMLAAELGDDASARRALEEAELEQVRLVDVLDRVRLLAERHGERGQPDGPAAEPL